MILSSNKKYFIIFSLILLASFLFSLSIGSFQIPISSIITFDLSEQEKAVLFSIRLPRIILSILVGAALGICGAAMQALFSNPLADPGLIGVSSSASLFVALNIILFSDLNGFFLTSSLAFSSFLGATIAFLIILYFAKISRSFSVIYMLLAGIAINAISGSITAFLTYLSNDQQLRSFTIWSMGNLGAADPQEIIIFAIIFIISAFFLLKSSNLLNIFLLGEEEAKNLGVNVKKLKITIILCVCILIGFSVSISGIIGFIGLIVPHLVRILFNSNNNFIFPASMFFGAILLSLADTFSRTIISPSEIPIGVITGLIGGPFFMWILIKQFKKLRYD